MCGPCRFDLNAYHIIERMLNWTESPQHNFVPKFISSRLIVNGTIPDRTEETISHEDDPIENMQSDGEAQNENDAIPIVFDFCMKYILDHQPVIPSSAEVKIKWFGDNFRQYLTKSILRKFNLYCN